jgi:putative transposase
VRLPWGIYSAPELEPYHGRALRVSFDPADGARVWVATPDGTLIAIATRDANARPYQPVSALEAAREGRQAARVKRLERRIAQVERDETPIIEGEVSTLPYLTLPEPGELVIETPTTVAALPETPAAAVTAPVITPPLAPVLTLPVRRHWIDDLDNDAARYEAVTHLKSAVARNEVLDDREHAFMCSFMQSAYYKRTEQMWADFERQTAAAERPGPRPL